MSIPTQNSYNKAAESYDKHSVSQRKIADKLSTYLPKTADKVLEIGCGTGYLAKKIPTKYNHITLIDSSNKMLELAKTRVPNAITKLVDFNLNIDTDHIYDLVLSCSALHWADDFEKVLVKIKKITSKNFIFSIMLDETLKEIREIRKEISPNKRIRPILYPHKYYLDVLKLHGFKIKHSEQMKVAINFKTVDHAMQHLRKTGVNAGSDKLTKREILTLLNQYEKKHRNSNGIPMTFKSGIYVTEIV